MELEQFTDLDEAISYLRSQGYQHTFTCTPEGWHCAQTNKVYSPDQLIMEGCHRFQKWGKAHKVAVLYQVMAPDGSKGTIIDCCSTYSNALFGEYLVRMKLHQIKPEAREQGKGSLTGFP